MRVFPIAGGPRQPAAGEPAGADTPPADDDWAAPVLLTPAKAAIWIAVCCAVYAICIPIGWLLACLIAFALWGTWGLP